MSDPLRVMVVDDTALYRKLLGDALAQLEGVEVVGTADDGAMALRKVPLLRPDVLTLDVEMPVMDGLETLRRLRETAPQVKAIMVSAHTTQGAQVTLRALELGAFDFITKPTGADVAANMASLQQQLQPLLVSLRTKKRLAVLRTQHSRPSSISEKPASREMVTQGASGRCAPARIDIVAIGVSTGGPQALAQVLPRLPGQLGVPIVIVQHMPPLFTTALAESLAQKSALRVIEGQHGQELQANTVYLAPGGKQMKLCRQGPQGRPSIVITDDPPENHCKPSVDYLFRSVAHLYGPHALAVIMTGMGADGVLGLRLLKRQGATVLAQDEASCVVFGMPMEAIRAGVVDMVVPLERLAETMVQHIQRI